MGMMEKDGRDSSRPCICPARQLPSIFLLLIHFYMSSSLDTLHPSCLFSCSISCTLSRCPFPRPPSKSTRPSPSSARPPTPPPPHLASVLDEAPDAEGVASASIALPSLKERRCPEEWLNGGGGEQLSDSFSFSERTSCKRIGSVGKGATLRYAAFHNNIILNR